MRQKYAVIRDDDRKTLIVREYAELDKEMMSLLCEESYPRDKIETALKSGLQAVIAAIRTNNMYPPSVFAQPIAEAVAKLMAEDGNQSAELFFDDKELFSKEGIPEEAVVEDEEADEDVAVDDLLDEGIDDDYDDENVITDLKSSIQVADDEITDMDE